MIASWGWRPWRRGGWGKGWGRGRGGWGPGWGPGAVPVQLPQNVPENAVPLERVPPGTRARVVAVLTGLAAQNRAFQMGIAPGSIVEVVDNNLMYPWTPIIIRVNNMTVAIGRGLASRILVVPLSGGQQQPRAGQGGIGES